MTTILNRIKQPSQCCVNCGKIYKTRSNLNKHIILCDLLHSSKKSSHMEDDEPLPSQRRLYQLLIELGQKYNRLEEKVDEINKIVIKKKKQINVLDWLNTNIIPTSEFSILHEKIIILDEDIDFLLHNSFNDMLNEIFIRNIYNNLENNKFPIIAFIQKSNTMYIYDKVDSDETKKCWIELQKDVLIKFLNRVQLKIIKSYQEWKKKNYKEIQENDSYATLSDKAVLKITTPIFKEEQYLTKIRSMMYNKMKIEIKTLIEYDFDF